MSSANLRRTPDATEHHDSVRDALVEVAENSFFAYVDPLDMAGFEELAGTAETWLRADVHFTGAFGGHMALLLPETLARELHASFLGAPPDEVAEDGPLFDLVGELANMVCGSWLTRTCQRRRFDLEHPAVARVQSPGAGPDPTADLLVALNSQPAWLTLTFTGA